MTSLQVAEWEAFAAIDGLPGARTQYEAAGQICAAVTNFSTWKVKEPLQPSHFFPMLKAAEVLSRAKEKPIPPQAHSELLMAALFKTTPAKAYQKGA